MPELSAATDDGPHTLQVIKRLSEFREHLGGRLTIMLLSQIGTVTEVHHIDEMLMEEASDMLRERLKTYHDDGQGKLSPLLKEQDIKAPPGFTGRAFTIKQNL